MARALDEGDDRLADKVGAVRDSNGVGALHLAAARGSLPVCQYLLEELRVDVNAVEFELRLAFCFDLPGSGWFSQICGNKNCVLVSLTGETALTFAINSGNADMVRYLLDHGADTEKLNNDGLTALHFAAGEEVAACCGARKDVEILFPVTSCIPSVHDWTVDGIISYVMSLPEVKEDDFCAAMLDMGKFQGREAVKNKDYLGATNIYTADYKKACSAFLDGLMLQPENIEMKNALREALQSLKMSDSLDMEPLD
ncbi:hypothetical protein E2562_014371 [Oryza meyeriana var. granulata]|uniref:Uncharacterized protein n=1 Tax=Oryza meyeriana var. granulata TaxID=110450 RepID=A0A6G1C7I9_9ORYZ|nr:hypothetical protein E2562_014371 [Oryza meyeriana var. granulata]